MSRSRTLALPADFSGMFDFPFKHPKRVGYDQIPHLIWFDRFKAAFLQFYLLSSNAASEDYPTDRIAIFILCRPDDAGEYKRNVCQRSLQRTFHHVLRYLRLDASNLLQQFARNAEGRLLLIFRINDKTTLKRIPCTFGTGEKRADKSAAARFRCDERQLCRREKRHDGRGPFNCI